MKSIYLQKDKSTFKLEELPADKFAESLGLPGTPKIKFLRKDIVQKKKNTPRVTQAIEAEEKADSGSSSGEDGDDSIDEKPSSKVSLHSTSSERIVTSGHSLQPHAPNTTVCSSGKIRISSRNITLNS